MSRGLTAVDVRTGPYVGSDHYPIAVDLQRAGVTGTASGFVRERVGPW
jgi:hypothetical protein